MQHAINRVQETKPFTAPTTSRNRPIPRKILYNRFIQSFFALNKKKSTGLGWTNIKILLYLSIQDKPQKVKEICNGASIGIKSFDIGKTSEKAYLINVGKIINLNYIEEKIAYRSWNKRKTKYKVYSITDLGRKFLEQNIFNDLDL